MLINSHPILQTRTVQSLQWPSYNKEINNQGLLFASHFANQIKAKAGLNFPDKRYLSLYLENEHTNNTGIRLAITTECYSGVCLMSGEKGEAE